MRETTFWGLEEGEHMLMMKEVKTQIMHEICGLCRELQH